MVRSESDRTLETLREKGVPGTYLVYPDEDTRSCAGLSSWAVTEAFPNSNLASQLEPLGDELGGSSVEVITGAEQIPGL